MRARDFALISGLALVLRLVAVFELSGTVLAAVPLGDARGYVDLARRIAAGEWLGSEVFYQAPLYPYLLGGLFALIGESLAVARIVQAVLGAVACALVADVTARSADRRAGIVAGLLAATYAPWVWTDGLLQKTSLALFLTALLFSTLGRLRSDASRLRWAGPGMLLGLLILTRENAAILALPIGWYVGRTAGKHALGSAALGLTLVLAPVGLRNLALGGTFLPTASNVGVNLYIGNGPDADGFYVPLVAGRGHIDHEAEDARAIAEAALSRSLSSAEVSGWFAAEAGHAITSNPVRFLGLLGRKLLLLANRREFMDAAAYEVYRDESIVLRGLSSLTCFALLLPVAVIGALRTRDRWSRLLIASAVLLAVGILPFFVVGRFRMGLVPLLMPLAGCGVVALVDGWKGNRRRELVGPACLGGLACAVAWLPLAPPGDPRATTYTNLCSELARQGDDAGAVRWGRSAVEREPTNLVAQFNLGLALKGQGNLEEAGAAFQALLELDADDAGAWAELGALHALDDDLEAAKSALTRALAMDPGHAAANYYRGLIHRNEGELDEAVAAYRRAVLRRPDFVDAHHNLGFAELARGRAAEALGHFENALAADPNFLPSLKQLAWLRATHPEDALRDGAAALELAERAVAATAAEDAEALAALACALAELGRFEEALTRIREARRRSTDPSRLSEAEEELAQGRPWRDETWH